MEVKIKYPKRKCAYCGREFEKHHNRQIYCSPECRNNAHREHKRNWAYRHYHQNKTHINKVKIGTRTIGPHKHPNNTREAEIVSNEKQRLTGSNCLDYNMKIW